MAVRKNTDLTNFSLMREAVAVLPVISRAEYSDRVMVHRLLRGKKK